MAKNIAPNPAPGTPSASAKARNASGAPSKNTTLVAKKGSQAADPTAQPKPSRSNVLRDRSERNGAGYGVKVGFEAHVAPEAGATQGNGRIVPHAIRRSAPNFRVGSAE